MIKSLSIKRLNSRSNVDINFNKDITIISGPNGCGKTNILKLLWYLVSPNVERAISEINFEEATLCTDEYTLNVSKIEQAATFESGKTKIRVEAENRTDDTPESLFPLHPRRPMRSEFEYEVERINRAIMKLNGSSLFFPTYRRIEEGNRNVDEFRRLASAVRDLADRVSVNGHKLIASVSAADIKRLINDRYALTSKTALDLRDKLLESITNELKNIEKESGRQHDSYLSEYVQAILEEVRKADQIQDDLFTPFNKMQDMLSKFLKEKSIKIDSSFAIGEMNNAVDADLLSAGEKQVLSFLAYNAFYENTPIIIDEPELSLHIDWQRALLPALLEQGTSNQLILATHSPFIYANYPEKEILLSSGVELEA